MVKNWRKKWDIQIEKLEGAWDWREYERENIQIIEVAQSHSSQS